MQQAKYYGLYFSGRERMEGKILTAILHSTVHCTKGLVGGRASPPQGRGEGEGDSHAYPIIGKCKYKAKGGEGRRQVFDILWQLASIRTGRAVSLVSHARGATGKKQTKFKRNLSLS